MQGRLVGVGGGGGGGGRVELLMEAEAGLQDQVIIRALQSVCVCACVQLEP